MKRPKITLKNTNKNTDEKNRQKKKLVQGKNFLSVSLEKDSLAFALLGSGLAVAGVKEGKTLPQVLSDIFTRMQATPQSRGSIQDLSYRCLRNLGTSEFLLSNLVNRLPDSKRLQGLLCVALTLLLPSENKKKLYDDFTVVNQAVKASTADFEMFYAKNMVNAVLRRFLREKDVLLEKARKDPVAFWNYPIWWIEEIRNIYPNDWKNILNAGNNAPPLTLRVNKRHITSSKYVNELQEKNIVAEQIGEFAVRLEKPVPVKKIPGFEKGFVSVQDLAAQFAAPLLDLKDGMRVLDACAAPGGKSGHILELAKVNLIALDVSEERLTLVSENLRRLNLNVEIIAGDASKRDWWDGRLFDRIIADVPCTASGVVCRHPDIRWLRRKDDSHSLAVIARKILDNLWQLLKPNGKMVFATCSIWPNESEEQAAAFVERHGAIRLPAPGQLYPDKFSQHDGLFYAVFQKPDKL